MRATRASLAWEGETERETLARKRQACAVPRHWEVGDISVECNFPYNAKYRVCGRQEFETGPELTSDLSGWVFLMRSSSSWSSVAQRS
jgi:hypothetical protein